MAEKPIPDHTDDAPSSETLHETVLDEGRIKVYSRFKPGDVIAAATMPDKHYTILSVGYDEDGASYRLDTRGPLSVSYTDDFFHLVPKPVGYLNVYAKNLTDDDGHLCYELIEDSRHHCDANAKDAPADNPRLAVIVIHSDGLVTVEDTRGES